MTSRRTWIIVPVIIIVFSLLLCACFPAASAGDIQLPLVGGSGETKEAFMTALNMTPDELKDILRKEIDYVGQLQCANGAITDNRLSVGSYAGRSLPDVDGISPSTYKSWPSSRMVPYFSDAACLGVISACRELGKDDPSFEKGQKIARAYIDWYLAHMNTKESDLNHVAGTVYDYFVFQNPTDKTIVEVRLHDAYAAEYPKDNPYDYDSTDSYAAMFLELLLEYTLTFDSRFIKNHETTVDTLCGVLNATFVNRLGLTGAKPNYMVCYMMDNCEVYCGWQSAAAIYRLLGKESKASSAEKTAEKIKNGISAYLYNKAKACYSPGVFENGAQAFDLNLSTFYPQTACQLFPVLFGVEAPDSERSVAAYSRFLSDFCKEGTYGNNWAAGTVQSVSFPWAILLRAVVKMGDGKTAGTFINNMLARYVNKNHPYPFYDAESGHLMTAISLILATYASGSDTTESSDAPSDPGSSAEPSSDAPESSDGSSAEPSKDDTSKQDTSKDDTSKQETSKDDTSKQETSKDDTSKQDTSKDDTSKQDTSKDDTSGQEPSEDESSKQAASEDGSSGQEPIGDESAGEPSGDPSEPVGEPSSENSGDVGGSKPWIFTETGIALLAGIGIVLATGLVTFFIMRKKRAA